MIVTQTGFLVGLLRGWLPWALLCAICAAVYTYWPRHVQETGKFEQLPPAKEVRTVEKIVERVKFVKVYPPEVKAKLNLAPALVKDEAQKVIATGKLEAEDRHYTLAAVMDTETGEAVIHSRPDPLPWIAPGKIRAVGIAYGIGQEGQTGKVYGYQELVRLKRIHAGLRVEADQHGEYWAGGYAELRF